MEIENTRDLDQIGKANEPAAICDLMSFGLVRNEEIRAKARSIIRNLFTQISIEALPLLDESLRQSWAHLEDWYGMRPEAIDGIGQNTDADRIFLGLATSHRRVLSVLVVSSICSRPLME